MTISEDSGGFSEDFGELRRISSHENNCLAIPLANYPENSANFLED